MKKNVKIGIALGIIAVLIVVGFYHFNITGNFVWRNSNRCVDKDNTVIQSGDSSYFEKSSVKYRFFFRNREYSDRCSSYGRYLYERYCSDTGRLRSKLVRCENGCEEGACVNQGEEVFDWVEYENNPIIKYQDLISNILWNDPSVIKEGDTYKMWLSGGDPFVRPLKVRIYYATSTDGIIWDINEEPVLESTEGEWDSESVETPSVIKVGDTYHMYYTGYEGDFSTGIYSIGHATSTDGITWEKDLNNPTIEPQDDPLEWGFYTTAEPGIVHYNNKFYLYYTSAKSNSPDFGSPFGIMVATSTDGSVFTDNQIAHKLTSTYDSTEYRGYSTPMVYVKDNIFYMYHDVVYNPDGFEQIAISSAKSLDGFNFEELEANIFTTNNGDWKDKSVLAPSVIFDENKIKMWFAGQTDNPEFSYGIGYAYKNN